MSYEKISVVFKDANKDLFQWIMKRCKEEDMSMSSFIVRSLKKIKKMEDEQDEKNKSKH